MPSDKVNINPELLTFARERSGYRMSAIANKLRVNEERWLQWERGDNVPTTIQLMDIAKYLDRTPAFFYLNEPPIEEWPLSEFRTINNLPFGKGSPKLIGAIREAKRNRSTLIELYDAQNKIPDRIPELNLITGTNKELAKKIRDWLGVSIEDQKSWRSSSEALTKWKNCIENKDIYIVQFPFVEVDECRGFAIAENTFPIIGINPKDSYNARIFTLIHELAHILFKSSVLINDPLDSYFGSETRLEQTCNELAAEILVPNEFLKIEYNEAKVHVKEVKRLSRLFCVSGYVLLIRLRNEKLITEEEFRDLRSEFSFYDSSGQGSNSGNSYYNQIVRKGKLYLKSVFQSYFQDHINIVELANLTGWKVPNLNELAAKTFGWPKEGRYV